VGDGFEGREVAGGHLTRQLSIGCESSLVILSLSVTVISSHKACRAPVTG